MRVQYVRGALTAEDLGNDPLQTLLRWIDDAKREGALEPNAMALATADGAGIPSLRFVLCKAIDARGVTFYTNFDSRKGREIEQRPRAAATFWWDRMERQVRVEGTVVRVADDEADAYFASRPHGSRVGAWASPQSSEIESRDALERRFVEARDAYPEGGHVPRPPFWGGYRIEPVRIEFWQGRANRVHDRIVFERTHRAGTWRNARLAP